MAKIGMGEVDDEYYKHTKSKRWPEIPQKLIMKWPITDRQQTKSFMIMTLNELCVVIASLLT